MHYELYIDLFFLINFLMDYFLLLMVGKMLKCRIRRLRIIAGAMVGAFSLAYLWSFCEERYGGLCCFTES